MIIRVSDSSNRHNGHYGIVYKHSEIRDRLQVLFLIDNNGLPCVRAGWVNEGGYEIIPDEENRDTLGWPPELCDSKIITIASDLSRLVKDGRKYRAIKELLKDER